MRRGYLHKSAIKVSSISRLIAKLIDIFLVAICCLLFYPIGLVLSLIYLAMSDSLQNGQSVGKKLMGFAVVSLEDGAPCSVKQSVIRNLPLLVPLTLALIPLWGWVLAFILWIPLVALEIYLICTLDSGHRLGDVMADTTVTATPWDKEKDKSLLHRQGMGNKTSFSGH